MHLHIWQWLKDVVKAVIQMHFPQASVGSFWVDMHGSSLPREHHGSLGSGD